MFSTRPSFFLFRPWMRTASAHSSPMRRRSLPFLPFISQRGKTGQQVVCDSTGKAHNVVRAAAGPTGKLLTRDKAGQPVEIERLQLREGKPVLLDRTNKQIDAQIARSGVPVLHNDLGVQLSLRPST